MKFYLASRGQNKRRLNALADVLTALGHEVVSTWHTRPYKAGDSDALIKRRGAAYYVVKRDTSEIDACDVLILYTFGCELTPGGLHFEAGYAKGKDKHVLLMGPVINPFCWFTDEQELRRIVAQDANASDRAPTHRGDGIKRLTAILTELRGTLECAQYPNNSKMYIIGRIQEIEKMIESTLKIEHMNS